MSASRLYLPLYMWACPQNFVGAILRTGPRPFMACSLVLWVGLQVGVLVAQEKYGPRFFVPQQFLPVKYNYRRAVPHIHQSLDDAERGESDELSCSICLNEVDVSANKYMVTPCNHFFHDTCLERWMDVKQECPVCRTALPSVWGNTPKWFKSSFFVLSIIMSRKMSCLLLWITYEYVRKNNYAVLLWVESKQIESIFFI